VIFDAPALCLIVSPSLRQSSKAFREFMKLYRKLDAAPGLTAESALRCELANGSRVVSLPGTERTVRGYSKAKLIVCDEAARIDDALMAAIRPMLAVTNGSLIMLSTPYGQRGEFHLAWVEGGEDWQRVRVSAEECPRLSKEFLAEELRELGPLLFKQEYGLEFISDAEAMFNSALIAAAFSEEVRPLWH
jgi:hypothetical protein